MKVILSIKNMSHPDNNDVFIRVFINKPDANPTTPIEDVHYAGSFYFFSHGGGHEHDEHLARPDYLVDVTKTLKRLQTQQELANFSKGITVNLVAVPVPGVPTQTKSLRIDDLELFISPIEVQLMNLK